ncbi:spidroin-2 isoform X4 [Astyanax mexicanus]|uniref:spidroin-2 isoform X4 n=1 Tax=Astyanax mexicanus TaxID=7994 RepID=UPI0020CAD88E|nr:spidroin-2 isoform X4 [Astyanax mexicanus]
MLSRNLIIASVAVVILATTVSTAPVEDKEPEENDFEAEEGEEELSEEEDGAGAQQATVVPKGPGVTALPGTSLVGQSPNGQKLNGEGAAQASFGSSSGSSAAASSAAVDDINGNNGKDTQALPSGSSYHDSSVSGHGGSTSGAVPAGAIIIAVGHGSSGSKVPGTVGTSHSDTISHGLTSHVSLSHVSPVQESPGHASPGQASSGHASPGHASPGQSSSGHASPGHASPGQSSSGHASPGQSSSGHASPGHASPGQSSSGQSSSGHASPGHASPGHASPGQSSSGHASPGHASPGHASPGHASPGHASSGHASPGHASPGHASPGHASPGHASSGHASPGHASPGHASPGHASPGHASPGHMSSVQASGHVSSQAGSAQTSGSAFVSSEIHSQPAASESAGEMPETESNGNGHKQLINGLDNGHPGLDHYMEGTTQVDLTGGFDTFGSSSHLEFTGMMDQSNHDFLIGLMGGMGDGFAPDPYTDTIGMPSDRTAAPPAAMTTCIITSAVPADHMGLAFQVESTAGPGPGHPASSSSSPETPADPSGAHHSPAGTGPAASLHLPGSFDNGAHPSSPGDTTGGAATFEMMSHADPSFMDYTEGAEYNGNDYNGYNDHNGAESPDINGNGRHRPVIDIHRGDPAGTGIHTDLSSPDLQAVVSETPHTAGEQLGPDAHTDTGVLDLKQPTLSPLSSITADGAVTGAETQTDLTGLAGEPVTSRLSQVDVTAMSHAIYSSSAPDTSGYEGAGVTEGILNHTDSVFEAGLGFTGASQTGDGVGQSERAVTGGTLGVSSQTDAVGTGGSNRSCFNLNVDLVLRNRHNELFQQVNSTTHLVRVLKVQKMWNWKIPADFHMKPRVKFLRYRFQCSDQTDRHRTSEPNR